MERNPANEIVAEMQRRLSSRKIEEMQVMEYHETAVKVMFEVVADLMVATIQKMKQQ